MDKKSIKNKLKREFHKFEATFLLCMVNRYEPLLIEIIKLYADNHEHPTHFRLLNKVGVDQGELTDVVELYYNEDTGSHIRLKIFKSYDRDEQVVETELNIQSSLNL